LQATWARPTQNTKENFKKKLKSSGAQTKYKRKFKKIKVKSSRD